MSVFEFLVHVAGIAAAALSTLGGLGVDDVGEAFGDQLVEAFAERPLET